MANKNPNTTHLKVGKAHSKDPIASAKASGTHFSNTTNHNVIVPTRDSKPVASDGYLGGKNSPDGARGWARINPAAAPNTYTGKGGSKRD
jgi:hypothetical protein